MTTQAADPGTQSGDPLDRRTAARQARRAFRSGRGVAASLAAVVLAVAAVLTAVEIIAALAGRNAHVLPAAWLTRAGHQEHWNDSAVLIVAGVACAAGVVMLAAALWPGRGTAAGLTPPDQDTTVGLTWASLHQTLAAAAMRVDGVGTARVRIRRRSARVTASSPRRDAADLPGQVRESVDQQLAELALLRPLRLRVGVEHQGE